MCIAALFAIAKIWKQTKRPSIDKWIKTVWYREFPGGPVVRTPRFPCQGPRCDSWSAKKKKKEKKM